MGMPKWECLSGNAEVGMPKWECLGRSGPKWGAATIGFLPPCESHCCNRNAIAVQNVALSITAEQKKSPAPMGYSDRGLPMGTVGVILYGSLCGSLCGY